jgi:hypothetical protein
LREFLGAPLSRYPMSILITMSHKLTRMRVREQLRTPDTFIGMVKSGDLDARWIETAASALVPGRISELMVHPSDGTDEGDPYGDHGPAKRRLELEAVTSPRVRAEIERLGIRLVDYRFLASC